MRLSACILPVALFVPSVSAFSQITAPKPLPAKVTANKAVTILVKGTPNDAVSATAVNGTISPKTTTLDSKGKATFTATFTAADQPGSVTISDKTGTSAWAYTGMTMVTAPASQPSGQNPPAAKPAVPAAAAPAEPAPVAQAAPTPAEPVPAPPPAAKGAGKKPIKVVPVKAAAPAVCIASPSANASSVTQQTNAMADFTALKSSIAKAPCTLVGSPACTDIAKELNTLATDAKTAWTALTVCSADAKVAAADQQWYEQRAAVWNVVVKEKKANPGSFADGTYTLPPPLASAINDPSLDAYAYPILNVPPSLTAPVQDGLAATLKVTADPNGSKSPLKYVWFKDGVAVPVAADDDPTKDVSYTTPPVVAADSGARFTVHVTGDAGSVTSQAAVLTVTGADADTEAGREKQIAASFNQIVLHEENVCIANHKSTCLGQIKQSYIDFKNMVDEARTPFPNIELDYASGTKAAPALPCASASPSEPSSITWIQGYDRLARLDSKGQIALLNPGGFAFCKPDISGTVAHTRVLAGIDVSAASAADPAARFLLEAAISLPLTKTTATAPLDARHWLWGYVRLASIASPGAISGVAQPSMYLSGLTSAAPNAIVQSFEANAGYKLKLAKWDSSMGQRPMLFSFIAGGGVITPLSNNQAAGTTANPLPIYTVTSALQTFYDNQAKTDKSVVNVQNGAAIDAACATTAATMTTPPTCYFSQYPEARSRFFRNYGAGFRVERYYYNGLNHTFSFPAVLDATIGQNDYVTGGQLHRLVTHIGGSTPLPVIGSLSGIYVYAALDMELSRSVNPAMQQQFLLTAAPSMINSSSPNFAAIFVGQPDRDRYRFGIAYDLTTLLNLKKP